MGFVLLAFKACGVLVSQTDTTAGISIQRSHYNNRLERSGELLVGEARAQTLDRLCGPGPWEWERSGGVQRATSQSSGQGLNVQDWEKK